MKKQLFIRTTMSILLLVFVTLTSSCSKSELAGAGPGGMDSRMFTTWQHQEILGSGSFTSTTVTEITFLEDGNGFEEQFSISPITQTNRKRANFSWTTKRGNKVIFRFEGSSDIEATYSISDSGNVMSLSFPNGNKIVYSRLR